MSDHLLCGAGKARITPEERLLPDLFGLAGAKFDKIHDDLYVRAVCFACGGARAIIVAFDLDKAPYPVEWVEEVSALTGIPAEAVFFLGIHAHTTPVTGWRPFEGKNFIENKPPEVRAAVREYEASVLEALKAAAGEAVNSLRPAKLGYGRGACYINTNRCQRYHLREAGGVREEIALGVNGQGPVDRTLFVLRAEEAETGAPIAFLTNYAVHGVAFFLNDSGEGKSFISGDIGGLTNQNLERAFPGAVSLWTSGPAGDVNPVSMTQTFYPDPVTGEPVEYSFKSADGSEAILRSMAYRHFDDVLAALRKVECTIDSAPVSAGIQWAHVPESAGGRDCEIRLHLIRVGPLAFIGVDGELFTTLGWAIQDASPVPDTVVMNHEGSLLLSNPGYILDDATMEACRRCGGGRLPGERFYAVPGAMEAELRSCTKRLFQ